MNAWELFYYALGAAAGLIAVLTFALTVGKRMLKAVVKFANFLTDWAGEEARPGVPRRLGVMERLTRQDEQLSNIQGRLAKVESEMVPNHGTTMKDAVHRIDDRIKFIEQKLNEGEV